MKLTRFTLTESDGGGSTTASAIAPADNSSGAARYTELKKRKPTTQPEASEIASEEINKDMNPVTENDATLTTLGGETSRSAMDYQSRVFIPGHITIEDTSVVDIILNGAIMKSGEWASIKEWLKNNWDTLQGTYFIAQDGMVLHRFKIA